MDRRKAVLAASGHGGGRGRATARRVKTRERLLNAAYRQFCAHGINGASIEAITDDADFSRGAFYSNFKSKEELFLALIEREHEARLEDLRNRFGEVIAPLGRATGKPAPEQIEEAIADILAMQPETRQWCLLNSEFRLLALRDQDVAARFLETKNVFQRQLAELVETTLGSVGLRLTVGSMELTGMLVDHFESTMQDAILSGVADPEQTARENVMLVLPELMHSLTELRDGAG